MIIEARIARRSKSQPLVATLSESNERSPRLISPDPSEEILDPRSVPREAPFKLGDGESDR